MAKVEFSKEIDCPPNRVYEVSQDYAVRYDWDPFPEKIEFLGGAKEVDVGVQVNVLAKSGLSMVVEFIQVSPPRLAAIKMVQGPFILKTFAGSWVFKPLPGEKTHAIFNYTLKVKSWALPFISNKLLNLYFGKQVKSRLRGLAQYCEKMPYKAIK